MNIDWAKIRTAYVTGNESLREIAARFGVSRGEIGRKSSSESWPEQRKKHRDKCATKARQKALRAQSDALAKIWQTQDLMDQAIMRMAEKLAAGEMGVIMGNGTPGRELESITKAIGNSLEIHRARYGLMAPRDAERLKLEREKFEHEKARAEAEKQGTDHTVQVVFADEWEDYAK